MSQHSHIINKQIIEVGLSDQATAYETQQKLSTLYADQLTPVLDRVLDRYFGDGDARYQMDTLTLDLGTVTLENMSEVLGATLVQELNSIQGTSRITVTKATSDTLATSTVERTPLRILAHYLDTGRLPWWLNTQKKSYLQEQWEVLMQNPTHEFKTLLSQLHHNKIHLDRYLHVFSESQVLQSAQWITGLSEQELILIRNKVEVQIRKKGSGKEDISSLWKAAFLRVLYNPKSAASANADQYYIQEALKTLGIGTISKTNTPQYKWLQKIQTLVQKYQQIAPKHQFLKDISKQCRALLQTSVINSLPVHLLTQIAVALEDLHEEIEIYPATNSARWLTLARHINTLDKIIQQEKGIPTNNSVSITRLQSQFEDTDFIAIENAGLVLFWPFLLRFFENLSIIKDKKFVDAAARHKAICALQYLCNSDESELFEGQLSLPKLLCGIPLDEPVPPILLTEEEKEIAQGLLKAVLKQGPHWKNLSIEGFRTSYINRQASLRTRDDHWLLQVQKETYDITLQKLPWSIQAIKLPWMERALMVEWL